MIEDSVVVETDRQPLDNAVWWALSSHHQRHAEAFGRARRYHSAIAAFAAVDEYDEDSWDDLATLVSLSESARCILFGGDPPAGLQRRGQRSDCHATSARTSAGLFP